jgi:TonB family protein
MGLMEFLRQWQGSRVAAGIVVSVAIHLLLLALAIGIRLPSERYHVKRGEPLIVELPRAEDSPPPGLGGAPVPPQRSAPRAAPAAPAAPAPKVAAASPARPAAPARQSAPTARSAPTPAPRAEPAPPSAAAVAAKPPEPAPTAATPSAPVAPDSAAPAEPKPATEPKPAAEPKPATEHPPAAEPKPVEPRPAGEPSTPQPQRQVASVPQPSGPAERAAPNILTALRRGAGGGAGGSGQGHAGIEGEPIPLDSTDPRYSDYLEQVRRRIKEKWGYPCEKNEQTQVCEYRSTQLLIEFGIQKNGQLAFVTLRRTSGHSIYDDYALNAVKLASPFPPIPDSFSKTGVPINAVFHYVLQSSLTNILR